ncbi:unnamed protein product, partial [Choristocarpus tenellus]
EGQKGIQGEVEGGVPPEDEFEEDGRRVLGVVARLAPWIPAAVATPLADDLLDLLLGLVARPGTSSAAVGALTSLCFAKAESPEEGALTCLAWTNHALEVFEDMLHAFVYSGSGSLLNHPGARACGGDMAALVERLLFAVGEVVVVGFNGKEDPAGPSDPGTPVDGKDPLAVRPRVSPRLVNLVQVLLPPRLPTTASRTGETKDENIESSGGQGKSVADNDDDDDDDDSNNEYKGLQEEEKPGGRVQPEGEAN